MLSKQHRAQHGQDCEALHTHLHLRADQALSAVLSLGFQPSWLIFCVSRALCSSMLASVSGATIRNDSQHALGNPAFYSQIPVQSFLAHQHL